MKRHYLRSILLFALFIPLVFGVSSAQSRSIVWERWDVTIDNVDTQNNTFNVVESYEILFDGTFRFGEAIIPLTNLTDIRNIRVSEGGTLLQQSCSQQAGTYCVNSVSEGVSIVYYFRQPITNARQSFDLEYTVSGALRIYDDGDQLWWIAVTDDKFGFSVQESIIRVELPPEFAPREGIDPVMTYGAEATVEVNGSTVIATANRGVAPNETFEIRVQYPHDPNASRPVWQSGFDQQRAFEETVKPWLDIGVMLISFIIAVVGPAGVYYLWYTRGRDPKVGPVPKFLTEPPSDLPPAVVGTLLDEQAQLRDVLSTLVDLANKGYIVIEEERKQGFLGIGGGSEFTFKRTNQPLSQLRTYEVIFIEKLFGSKNALERSMKDLKNKFYVHIPALQNDLYKEMVADGLFENSPESTRNGWMALAIIILVGAGGVGTLVLNFIEDFSPSLLCLPFAIGITGVAFLLVSSHMPSKSRKGAEEAAKWNAFREYLQNLQSYQSIEDAIPNFERYLPYAVAFGLDRSWIRRFSKIETVPAPTWYYPRYRGGRYSGGFRPGSPAPSTPDFRPGEIVTAGGSGGNVLNDAAGGISSGLNSISDGLTSMLNSASSTFTSTPPSSKSSGSWSSGGRNWSGGGSSGGGGSGGGSRGFG